jgi:LacI family transcriptional regulator
MVVSALTPDSRAGLAEGVVTMVTNTPLERLCRELVSRMAQVAMHGPGQADGTQHFLPPSLHVRESL